MKKTVYLTSKQDGLKLHVLLMEPEQSPKGIVQICHGMAEHKERYEPFMQMLCNNGYISVIHDHRGHGKSVKDAVDLGYFYDDSGKAIIEDAHQVTTWMKERYGSTMAQALKTVLPVREKVRSKEKRRILLNINEEEAIALASRIIIEHFEILTELNSIADIKGLMTEQDEDPKVKALETSIDDMEFSVRAYNCLKRSGINTMQDLVNRKESDMMKIRNLGKKSLKEVLDKVKEMGLSFRDDD